MSLFADLGIVQPGLFCVAVLLLNLTPGPDTAFIVGQSVAHGRRAGLLSVLGISVGCAIHTVAVALGLTALLAASTSAFLVVKVVGAAYLVFLGSRMLLASLRPAATMSNPTPGASTVRHRPASRTFVQGLLTNLFNPKVVLFFLSFFPQFVAGTSASKATAFVVLGGMLVAISTVYNGCVAWVAAGATHRMRSVPRIRAWLDRAIGAAFIALGARIAFTDR